VITIEVDGGQKIFSWCPTIEDGALKQMEAIAKLPFTKHCALMPDSHLGKSMPIGGVVGLDDAIAPDMVGVDIGCGMASFRTSLKVGNVSDMLDTLHHAVERSIPMGFSHNKLERSTKMEALYGKCFQQVWNDLIISRGLGGSNAVAGFDKFFEQMGTLGGGNHFIEIQKDEEDTIWVMVHSGSRNAGKRICDRYNEVASDLNATWRSATTVPFLPAQSSEGKDYIAWMNMALEFAYLNRMAMLAEILQNLKHYFPDMQVTTKEIEGVEDDTINIHHNYAHLESHMGKNMWVHRKGATLASDKTIGIIPGSMGSPSYIVRGLGNRMSLMSCSHGAGRRMGRKDFNVQNNTPEKLAEIKKAMEGITHTKFGKAGRGRDAGMLDVSEAPQAYKDITEVMANQADLVKPIVKLVPVINWKDCGEE